MTQASPTVYSAVAEYWVVTSDEFVTFIIHYEVLCSTLTVHECCEMNNLCGWSIVNDNIQWHDPWVSQMVFTYHKYFANIYGCENNMYNK